MNLGMSSNAIIARKHKKTKKFDGRKDGQTKRVVKSRARDRQTKVQSQRHKTMNAEMHTHMKPHTNEPTRMKSKRLNKVRQSVHLKVNSLS